MSLQNVSLLWAELLAGSRLVRLCHENEVSLTCLLWSLSPVISHHGVNNFLLPSHTLMFIGKQTVNFANVVDSLKISCSNTALHFRLLN